MTVGHIGVESEGEIVVLVLHGEHDLSTAPDVRAAVDEAVGSGRDVIVDLSATEFIDTASWACSSPGYRGVNARGRAPTARSRWWPRRRGPSRACSTSSRSPT